MIRHISSFDVLHPNVDELFFSYGVSVTVGYGKRDYTGCTCISAAIRASDRGETGESSLSY